MADKRLLPAARTAALIIIAALVAAATVTAFAESFRGLYGWAAHHDLPGWWAAVWPLMVDVFVAVGELALFVSVVDGWDRRSRYGAWAITTLGLAASIGGNVGHIADADWLTRLTAAVPPVAAACSLAVGLGVLKRVTDAVRVDQAAPGVDRAVPLPVQAAPVTTEDRAMAAYRQSIKAGGALSQRALAEGHCGGNRHMARRVIATAGLNGQGGAGVVQ